MQRFMAGFVLLAVLCFPAWPQDPKLPVQIGLDAEFTLDNSVSAQAIEKGMRIAIAEINANGGVLQGRPLELVLRDNGSIPARGIKNIREFSTMPQVVAVFGGRFSPVLLEEMAVVKETGMLLLAPWSSADPIINNGMKPNRVFRLSLQDSLAMPKMLETSSRLGLTKVGLLLTNTGWGRSNKAAAENYVKANRSPAIVHTAWYNFKDTSLIEKYESLRRMGAQAVILVANDDEAAVLVREMAALPREQRVPILSHWGVAGGQFVRQAGPALQDIDFTVIQTFSFFKANKAALAHFFSVAKNFGLEKPEDVIAPTGVAHAYDLTHILAKAINLAGSADRDAVRNALERVKNHRGVVKFYTQPFSATDHEALTKNELLMARFRNDGVLIPVN
ncbi:MAG: ABC transporter substrate-binding protein [Polaromonas sp.]|jgi:branched-chain amino acid transport system substrate-binding protein|nr:ABC transporter substrate-binding protein [Polaromonas sp.]